MSKIGKFQDRVNGLTGSNFNFQIDRPHGGKPAHVDLSSRVWGGVDKLEVDFNGNVIGGATQIGKTKMKW